MRLRLGATQSDLVRLHGVIVAALTLYPRQVAIATVFTPALDQLAGDALVRARDAIAAHRRQSPHSPRGSVVG